MQFFLLILFNIFMGAILYLIISLKLERSATEFRSKRLRKEMDEVIKEFNGTAERNITILENRISVLQRMLERSGQLKSLDISVDDGPDESPAAGAAAVPGAGSAPVSVATKRASRPRNSAPSKDASPPGNDASPMERTDERPESGASDTSLSQLLMGRVRTSMNSLLDRFEKKQPGRAEPPGNVARDDQGDRPEGGVANPAPAQEVPAVETVFLDEEEIRRMIRSAGNRYEAISDLHRRGYSLETISRCSGIPAGEISLVLNLNSARSN
jgi:hypothetical protein